MNKKCLYFYQDLSEENDYHKKCSLLFFGTEKAPFLDYTLEEMSDLAKSVVESSVVVPGVQPKLSLGFVNDLVNNGNIGRLTILGALGGNYILKPQNTLYPQMPENEHATMLMAQQFGIPTVPASLIRLKSGELSYITKRIDRLASGEKKHMLDMFQILEAFEKYRGSMEKVGKAVEDYCSNILLDLLRLFELTLFCYITGNNDMHLKNFSLILNNNEWSFSEAYDLLNVNLHLPEDTEEAALTINGKKNKISVKDFINLGIKFGLNEKQIKNTFSRLVKNQEKMIFTIEQSFLSEENKVKYIELIKERLKLFI